MGIEGFKAIKAKAFCTGGKISCIQIVTIHSQTF